MNTKMDTQKKQPALDAPLIEWAVWHIKNGLATGSYWVTPLLPGEKRPYQAQWSRKPLKSVKAVQNHWSKHKNDNIGLVPQPGHFWLDADNEVALEKAETHYSQIPDTYTQQSINGNLHLLLKGDVAVSPNLSFEGERIGEIRGAQSGQCVGAGSRGKRKDGKLGHWETIELSAPAIAPIWLLDLIEKGSRTVHDIRNDYGEVLEWDGTQSIGLLGLAEEGKTIKNYAGPFDEGERDSLTYRLFAEAKNRMIHPDAILEVVLDSGIAGGLEDEEIYAKLRSVYYSGNTRSTYGSKVGSYWFQNHVFSPIIDGQPSKPRAADPVEWKRKNRRRLPSSFPGDPSQEAANDPIGCDPAPTLMVVSFAEVLRTEPMPVPELVPGRIEKGVPNFLSGAGGSHKSRLALQYCVSIAAGIPIFGKQPDSAWPVYLSAEDDKAEVNRRLHKMFERLGINPKTSMESTSFLDRQGMNNALAYMEEGGAYNRTDFHDQLQTFLSGLPNHKFVVLDSCYDFVRFKGNAKINEDAVNAFIKEVLGALCRETNSTLLLPWHPSYSGQGRGDGSGWSVAWNNAPRVRDQIRRMDDTDTFELTAEKRSHGAKPMPLKLHYSGGALLPLNEIALTERNAELTNAVIKVAAICAVQNLPIQRQRNVGKAELDLLRDYSGFEIKPKEMKDTLNKAVLDQLLKYVNGDKYRSAGYYPIESWDELAKEVKRSQNQEKSKENSATKSMAKTRQKPRKNRG